MATWPAVVTRLLTLLPTLPGWDTVSVYDGAAFDSVPPLFVTVAHSTDGVSATAGAYATSSSPDGFTTIENGSVANQMTYTDDTASMTVVRSRMFGLLAEIEKVIYVDRTLGVLSQEGTADLEVDVTSMQAVSGYAQTLTFTLTYFTVI